jgi:peptide deformylase
MSTRTEPAPFEIVTVDSARAGVLRRRARAVGKVTPEVAALIDRLLATMRAVNGLGLAAPQVGESRRVFVAEVEDRVVALVDPVIASREGQEVATEACLSIPGVVAPVSRATRVTVKGKNRRGRGVTVEAEGLLARVLQHEIDHLDGILFLDRVEDPSTIQRIAEDGEGPEGTPVKAAAG